MTARKIITFTVRGRGTFPYDMLRYDSCWPADGASVAAIELPLDGEPKGVREVRLNAVCGWPTDARWASFGWAVIEGSIHQ